MLLFFHIAWAKFWSSTASSSSSSSSSSQAWCIIKYSWNRNKVIRSQSSSACFKLLILTETAGCCLFVPWFISLLQCTLGDDKVQYISSISVWYYAKFNTKSSATIPICSNTWVDTTSMNIRTVIVPSREPFQGVQFCMWHFTCPLLSWYWFELGFMICHWLNNCQTACQSLVKQTCSIVKQCQHHDWLGLLYEYLI